MSLDIFNIYKVFVFHFMRVFILLHIRYRGVSRAARILVEMSISTPLGRDLTQSYQNLYLLVWWHFRVDEDSFQKVSFGHVFMFQDVPYKYLSLISPRFFKIFSYIVKPLIYMIYIFMTFVNSLKYLFILVVMFKLYY